MPNDRAAPATPDGEGYADDVPDRPKPLMHKHKPQRASAISESTDSGYSSIHSSAFSSTTQEGYRKPRRARRARDTITESLEEQRVSSQYQRDTDPVCWDANCYDAVCLQKREASYQHRQPPINHPPPPSNVPHQIHHANPFTPLGHLAFASPDHRYGPIFGYAQPSAPLPGQYLSDHHHYRPYVAPAYQSISHVSPVSPVYHDPYHGPTSFVPHPTGPTYADDHTGVIGGQGDHAPNYSDPPSHNSTHRSRREHQHRPRTSVSKRSDMAYQESKARLREGRRIVYDHRTKCDVTKTNNMTSGQTNIDSHSMKDLPRDSISTSQSGKAVSTDDARPSTEAMPPSSDSASRPHSSDPVLLSSPLTDANSDDPQAICDSSSVVEGFVAEEHNYGEAAHVADLARHIYGVNEELPPPYLPSVAETEPISKDHAPITIPDPASVSYQGDLKTSAHHMQEAESEESVLHLQELAAKYLDQAIPQTQDLTSSTLSTQNASIQPAKLTSQDLACSDSAAHLPDGRDHALDSKQHFINVVPEAGDETVPEADDKQSWRLDTAVRFSQAVIAHCRAIQQSTTRALPRLRGDIISLLENYSRIMFGAAKSSEEELAAESVQEHKEEICGRLLESISPPTANEKVDSWWEINTNPEPSENSSQTQLRDILVISSPTTHNSAGHDFLVDHAGFRWLIDRIAVSMAVESETNTDQITRTALLDAIGDGSRFRLDVEWDVQAFFVDQYENPEYVELTSVICICATGSAAQAMSVGEYISMIWPQLGSVVLKGMNAALRNMSRKQQVRLTQGDVISINLRDGVTIVEITASPVVALEVCEVVTWMATACRASPSSDHVFTCKPSVVARVNNTTPGCCVQFELHDAESELLRNTNVCWRRLFLNPVLADGYPISARSPGEEGLQLSLEMMLLLGQTPWITSFEGTTMLKGFNSLFVPMACPGSSVLWHLLLNDDGTRLPYGSGAEMATEAYSLDNATLQSFRHFVGWTRAADILAGSRKALYDIGRSATDASKPAAATLSAVNITVSKIVGVGMTLTRGKKDTSPALTGGCAYDLQVNAASQWNVIMHDTEDRRAWLLDGASALVHIGIANLYLCDELLRQSMEADGELEEETSSKTDELIHPESCKGRETARNVLLNRKNRVLRIFPDFTPEEESVRDPGTGHSQRKESVKTSWWCWKDLVTEKFAVLELLHDQSARRRTNPVTEIRLPFGSRSIEGFEFYDIVQGNGPLQPRVTSLSDSYGDWLDFSAEIDAIVLFGSGFGELIKPSEMFSGPASQARCGHRASCPVGHDYLAAPISLLIQIYQNRQARRDRFNNCIRLGEKTFWHDALVPLEHCDCQNKSCSIKTAKLQKVPMPGRTSGPAPSPEDVFARFPQGAVIFGSGKSHGVSSTRRDTLTMLPPKTSKHKSAHRKGKEPDSGIDMEDSSGSNLSPVSPRTNSPPDSGIGLDSPRPPRAWVRQQPSVAESSRTGSSQNGRSEAGSSRQHRNSTHVSSKPKGNRSLLSRWAWASQAPSSRRHSSRYDGQTSTSRSQSGRDSGAGSRQEHDASPTRSTRRDAASSKYARK